MKLFAIYIGGEAPGANIEVHDMRFVAATSIADCYDALRNQWWGRPGSLHIDCWAEINHVDGYDIELRPTPFLGAQKLYYVNLGGYDPGEFTEKHRNVFVVANTKAEAKARALQSIERWNALHRDNMYEAEQTFSLDNSVHEQRLYLHFIPAATTKSLRFTCAYTPIKARA